MVLYNVACNYATLGKNDQALEYLEQAMEHGTISVAWMRNDEDLASIRDQPRFSALLEKLTQQPDADCRS